MLKIGIDFRLGYNSHRGMGRYIRSIVNHLGQFDKDIIFILFIDNKKKQLQFKAKNLIFKHFNCSNYIFFEQVILPFLVFKENLDYLWCPGNTFPLLNFNKTKLIVTIHDLIFFNTQFKRMNLKQYIGKLYRKIILNLGIKKITKIFTDSKYSKSEIIKKFNISTNNIYINKLTVEISSEVDNSILTKLNIKHNKYYFSVSGDTPSKNLLTLLDLSLKLEYPLVIAGLPNYQTSILRNEIEKYNINRNIIICDKLTESELHSLYRYCRCFLFLSLAEGFGLPILEAMYHHKPIVASNLTSIPEVLGKGGILVDPLNKSSILTSILKAEKNDYSVEQEKQLIFFGNWNSIATNIIEEILIS